MRAHLWSPVFMRLFAGQAVSGIGSQITVLALPIIAVVVLDATALQAGLLAGAASAAHVVAALPAGAWLDRVDQRPVLVAADLVSALVLLTLPVVHLAGALTLAYLYLAALLGAVCQLLSRLARQTILPAVVAPGALLVANTRMDGLGWLTNIAGPSLGGLLIAATGPVYAVVADAFTFTASAALSRKLPRVPRPRRPAGSTLIAEIRQGWQFLRSQPTLLRMMFANGLMAWTILFAGPAEVIFVLRELAATPVQYGLAFGLPSLGGLAGIAVVTRLVTRWGIHRVMWWAGLGRGPWLLLLPLAAEPGWWGLSVVAIGWTGLLAASAIYNTAQTTYRQQVVPPHLRGRVFASWTWFVRVGQPFSPLLGGALVTLIGTRATLVTAALLLCCCSLLLDRSPAAYAETPVSADSFQGPSPQART